MEKLNLDLFLDYTYLSDLQLNFDKSKMSFITSQANLDANNYSHKLHLSDGKEVEEILSLSEDARYLWEDSENILYFTSQKDLDKKLKDFKYSLVYRYNLKEKKKSLAYKFKIPVSSVKVLSNEELLITSSLRVSDHKLLSGEINRLNYLNELKDADFYHAIEEVPFQTNGGDFIHGFRSQAFIYNIKEDSYTPLVNKNVNFNQHYFDKENKKIIFTSSKAKSTPNFFDHIEEYSIENKTIEKLYGQDDLSISNIFSLKDEIYVLASDMQSHGINQNPDFYKLVDNKLVNVCDFKLSSNNSIGSDVRFGKLKTHRVHEDKFYFVGTLNDRSSLYQFDGQQYKSIYTPKGAIDSFIFYEESLYTIGLFNDHLQELYKARLKKNDQKVVTSFNQEVLKDKYVSKAIKHNFKNDDTDLEGWVLLPKNYNKKEKYPAILDIHGGPKTIYSDVFYHEMQVWANMGYIVFFTNPRGGDAYGDDFANIRGKYGSIDYDDIMAFTDLVIEEYSVDVDRIGVTGGSYGGFMTNWIVSHTDRFKAAATQRSISNWISFYGTSDIGPYFGPDQTGGHPLLDHDKVWAQSPLKYANNIKTPLLLIHSDKDYRCPIEQAMQLYTVVKMNGVDSKLVWFKDENHDLSRSGRPKSRLKRLEEITNWMEKYLK